MASARDRNGLLRQAMEHLHAAGRLLSAVAYLSDRSDLARIEGAMSAVDGAASKVGGVLWKRPRRTSKRKR
jgi:hypothetical protein